MPNVCFGDHENDITMRKHTYIQAERIYGAAGATKTFRMSPHPSTYNLDTACMSTRPQDGVCNKWGQTHDIANPFTSNGSQFITSGSENPTLTIAASVIRQADYVVKQMLQRSI